MTEVKEVVKTSRKYYPYSQYRDAEVECLDSIPSHWQAHALKHALEIRITDGPHETPEFLDEGVPFVSAEAVAKGYIDFNKIRGYISVEDDKRFSRKYSPQKHDVYMVKSGATTGVTAIVETEQHFNIWSPLAVMRCNQGFEPYYLLNYLRSRSFRESVELNWSFGTQQNIGMGTLENLPICHPPIDEQRTIAAFLDYETARIDSLIDKQQRLIELLKEKRQAVISHAVTKGLNPDAPMKDSGVEWLGQVPEHWDVCRLKHIATIQSGIAKGGKDLSGKALISVPMLRVANVQDGFLKLDDIHTILIEEDMLNRYSLRDGDVLMNEGGDNDKLGRGAIWREQIPNCIHQNHVFAIRTAGVEPEWLDMLTRASYAKFYFFSVAKQSTNLASISASNIKETPILVPPQNERFEILEFLEKQLSRFDLLVQRCNNQIYLLKERRTALISAAVTGKIDLRNWSPSNA
ncbi:restriction endonuclease subunit S [Shewanella algae]|uniref:restriction endonuclease subunit S n=1 Tax=Shewanella algae TaxID=38313 RepID=UPI003999E750